MATFTSTLPDDLFKQLRAQAGQLAMPMNKLIEKALRIYLDQLNRAEYVKSYQEIAKDEDLLQVAEEGMEEYLKQLPEE